MSTPVAATCSNGIDRELRERESEHPDPRAEPERDHGAEDEAGEQAGRRGQRGEHEGPAAEGHDGLAAAKRGEDRQRVADHGCAHPDVGSPYASQRETGQPRGQALEPIAQEHGRGGAPAELLHGVPGTRVAVTDLAQVHAVGAADQQRDRDRAEQISDNRREPQLDHGRLLSPHPLPAIDRARGILAHGLRPAGAEARRGSSLLAAARHRAGADDDHERRPAALGPVRGLGRRGGAHALSRAIGGRGAVARAGERGVACAPRARALARGLGRGQPARRRVGRFR